MCNYTQEKVRKIVPWNVTVDLFVIVFPYCLSHIDFLNEHTFLPQSSHYKNTSKDDQIVC